MPGPEQEDGAVAVALGSNRGRRARHLAAGVEALGELLRGRRCSSVYESRPVGGAGERWFLNMCCIGSTDLAPRALLDRLLAVEERAGRERRPDGGTGPRTLDLDLLLYGTRVIRSPGLEVPHPAMQERPFVLVPLAEVAPGWRHPVAGRTVGEMAGAAARDDLRLYDGGLPPALRSAAGGRAPSDEDGEAG